MGSLRYTPIKHTSSSSTQGLNAIENDEFTVKGHQRRPTLCLHDRGKEHELRTGIRYRTVEFASATIGGHY